MINASFDSKTGTISLAISAGDGTIDAQILSIGQLSYAFDQTPESVSIERVQALYSYIQIDLMQYSDLGEDLWDILVDGATTADIPVTMTLTDWERNAYEFPMKLRLPDIGMDERSRKVTIRLIPNADLEATTASVFNAVPLARKVNFSRRIESSLTTSKTYIRKATGVKDWIEAALNVVFDNAFSNEVETSDSNLPSNYTTKIYDTVDGIAANTRSLVMLQADSTNFDAGQGGYRTIQGQGLVSSTGERVITGETVITYLTITGASFIGQVELNDTIIVSGVSYGLTARVIAITASQITLDTGGLAFAFTDLPWAIGRPVTPDQTPAVQVLKDLAGIEGSVFGTGFSKNFYFNRLQQGLSSLVTIDYDMVMDFKPKPFFLSLGNSIVAQRADFTRGVAIDKYGAWPFLSNNTRIPNLRDYTSIAVGNANATKELKIELAPAYPMLNKGQATIGGFNGDYSGADTDADNDTTLERALTTNGIKSYFQALNRTEGGISIEFTVMGALSVFPWNTIQFDTRAPEKYRNRQFRPTGIKYNFVNDTVTITAYQIDDVQTPVYPEPYLRTGLNFKFGEALLEESLGIAVNDLVADGLRLISTFILTAPIRGTTTQLNIDRGADTTTIIPANYKVLVINPFNTTQRQEFTVSQDMSALSTVMFIETAQVDIGFPAGSYVYVTTQSVQAGVIYATESITQFTQSQKHGVLTNAVNGTVTSIPVRLYGRLREGEDFVIINALNGQEFYCEADQDADATVTTLAIKENFINAPAGSTIQQDGGQKQTTIYQDPGLIELANERYVEANAIATLSTELAPGPGVTSIPITGAIDIELLDNDSLIVRNKAGETQEFIVNGNQTLTPASTSITVDSVTNLVSFDAGDTVFESSAIASAKIQVLAGTLVLKATLSSGSINKLALVRLDATAASGSTILLQANQITLDGQTTFINSLAENGFNNIPDNNVVIYSATAPATREDLSPLVAGDVWRETDQNDRPYVWTGSAWRRGFVIIDGGSILAGTVTADQINVNDLFAQTITVSGSLSGSSGATAWTLDSFGFYMGQFGGLLATFTRTGVTFEDDATPTNPRAIFSTSTITLEQSAGNADFTVGVDGTVVSKSSVTANSLIVGTQTNKATISYTTNETITLTIPDLGGSRTFAFINEAQTFTANQTVSATFTANTVVVGTQTNKATISYTTNTARTLTIPNVGGNRTFSFIDQAETLSGQKTFTANLLIGTGGTNRDLVFSTQDGGSNTITITLTAENGGTAGNKTLTLPNSTGTLLTQTTADGRYGRLSSANSWTNTNTFTGDVIVPNSTTSNHALNRITADGRYGQLGSANVWTASQRFTNSQFSLEALPTSDPGIPGRLWVDGSNFVKVSP